jgi:hypothetical protein
MFFAYCASHILVIVSITSSIYSVSNFEIYNTSFVIVASVLCKWSLSL